MGDSANRPARPTLFLIHGAGGSREDWPTALRARPDVVALDLPGHGEAAGSGCDTVTAYAAAVLTQINRYQTSRWVAAGHSLGGAIALTLALQAPAGLAGLILISTGARLRVNPFLLQALAQQPDLAFEQMDAFCWGADAAPAVRQGWRTRLAQTPPAITHGDLLACDQFDVRSQVSQITRPTLVLYGMVDQMTPPKHNQFLADQIAGAQRQAWEGAGHMLPLERPQAVTAAIQQFLATL